MSQRVLCVLSHRLMPEQKAMLKTVHGKTVNIDVNDTRFDDPQHLHEFHEEMEKIYDFIYYVLSKELKQFLQQIGKTFRVLTAKKITAVHTDVRVLEYTDEEKIIRQKTYCKHTESKYYFNRFFPRSRF